MGPTGSASRDSNEEETLLIPGLLDDVAIRCLARVPRIFHAKLKCVSKKWRDLVCGEDFRIIRKKYNLQETWIYAFCAEGCYVLEPYALRRYWKRTKDLPPCIVRRQDMKFEVLGHKAYLIGGRDYIGSERLHIADEVHCYDAISNSWSKVAPLSTPRCGIATGVLDGKIYAVGSLFNPDGKHTWETYDPIMNMWTVKSDRHMIEYSTETVVYNGKLYVRCYVPGAYGAVYDPSAGIWHYPNDDMMLGWHGTIVVADGRLFSLDMVPECVLRMWDEDKKEWVLVANMSCLDKPGPVNCYRLAAIGKCIFFIGMGLFTAVLDITNVGKGVEILSDVMQPKIIPVVCKCITI